LVLKTLNNAGLLCYFLAAKVDSMEVAGEMGKTYSQVKRPKENICLLTIMKKQDRRQFNPPS